MLQSGYSSGEENDTITKYFVWGDKLDMAVRRKTRWNPIIGGPRKWNPIAIERKDNLKPLESVVTNELTVSQERLTMKT